MLERKAQIGLLSRFFSRKLIKSNKINLFGKAITTIDCIQAEKYQVNTLTDIDLSHNSIQQLGEISQFRQVQVLNLANNKIKDLQQMQKLFSLRHLHMLCIKNNPFSKKLLSNEQLRFLVSLNTDVPFINEQTEQKIGFIVKQTQQLYKFRQFQNKIKLHCQLFQQKKIIYDSSFNPSNLLPKIKRYFEHVSFVDSTLRRSLIMKIDLQLFKNQQDLTLYLEENVKNVKKYLNQVFFQINHQIQLMNHFQFKSIQVKKNRSKQQTKKVVFRQKVSLTKENMKEKEKSIFKLSPNKSKSLEKIHLRKDKSIFQQQGQQSLLKSIQIQNQFTNVLGKIHPSFQLLHSPLESLKPHQKDLLIQQLLNVLKDSLKLNIKLRSAQQQNIQQKEQIKDLKKHLVDLTNQISQYQRNNLSKINELQKNYQLQFSKACLLSQENKKLKSQNKQQQQTIDLSLEQSKIKKNENQSYIRSIKNTELIHDFKEKSLKNKYFALFLYKGIHFNKLKHLKKVNQKNYQKQLKQFVIYELKINVYIAYLRESLTNKIKLKQGKFLLSQLCHIRKQRKTHKQLVKLVKNRQICKLIKKLALFVWQNKQHQSKAEGVLKNIVKVEKKTFIFWLKMNSDQVNSQILQKQMFQSRKDLLIKKTFRKWKDQIAFFKKHSISFQKQHKIKKKKAGLKQFIGTMSYQNNLISKASVLRNFVPHIRKIKAFLFFTKKFSSCLLKREINANKIKLTKKHAFFSYFLSLMKHRLMKKIFQKQKQQKRKQVDKQKENRQTTLIKKRKDNKIKLKSKILKMALRLRQKMFQRHILTRKLQNFIRLNIFKQFMLKFRSLLIDSLLNSRKNAQLDKHRFQKLKLHTFFAKLLFLKNNRKAKIRKANILKMKTFYQWKILFKQHNVLIYRQKFNKVETHLKTLTQNLIKTQEQNVYLAEKLQEKEILEQQYLRKCQELSYLLQSKQLKYQNLKNIYQETIKNSQFNRQYSEQLSEQTKLSNKNRFLKHVENQLRKEQYNEAQRFANTVQKKYSFQKDKITKFKNKNMFKQYDIQASEKTQPFTFISSFKRF